MYVISLINYINSLEILNYLKVNEYILCVKTINILSQNISILFFFIISNVYFIYDLFYVHFTQSLVIKNYLTLVFITNNNQSNQYK